MLPAPFVTQYNNFLKLQKKTENSYSRPHLGVSNRFWPWMRPVCSIWWERLGLDLQTPNPPRIQCHGLHHANSPSGGSPLSCSLDVNPWDSGVGEHERRSRGSKEPHIFRIRREQMDIDDTGHFCRTTLTLRKSNDSPATG